MPKVFDFSGAVAPATRPVTVELFDGWAVALDIDEVTRPEYFSHSIPNSGQRLRCGGTIFDFMVDGRKEPLRPSRVIG